MSDNLKLRIFFILIVMLAAVFYALPTFTDSLPQIWKKHADKIRLGLDLQGGMHLILEVEAEKAVNSTLERISQEIKDDLRDGGVRYTRVDSQGNREILVELTGEDAKEKLDSILDRRFPYFSENVLSKSDGSISLMLTMADNEAERIKRFAVDQGLETIRNRIDQFGVSEPEIAPQGDDRILIQLPGIKDSARAINLIGRTALLEFKLVDEEMSAEQAMKTGIPPGDEILYHKITDPGTGRVIRTPYLLNKRTLMTGEVLVDAKVRIDSQFNQPYVGLKFDSRGARMFDRITAANVKKRLAIVLDNNVYSAPVIQERISGGEAQITGQFTMEEARDLAIVLRAGSLPAPVKILENRTVGPSLGRDSIRQGIISMIFGSIVVVAFMIVYYRGSGIVANVALILNLILIMAVMAGFKAVLTLPGIAGIILTIGMAVDANVLIYERVREELRVGKTPRAAIDGGYSKALTTILDANITTLIAGVVLFQFGTGPVKGFAVTLSVGIISSLFTALVVTRVIFDYLLLRVRVRRLSI